ncbi:MAG: single-stranded DNA-binding protein [Thermoguttaceae bacterium]
MSSPSFNRVILLGRLTRDPEIRYTPNGTPVSDVRLAINERTKNADGEWVDEALFVDVTLWSRTAEVASEYLSKGSLVLIEGRLKLDTWEQSDGQKQSKMRVVCHRMQMLGGRGAEAGAVGEGEPRQPAERQSPYRQAAPGQEAADVPPPEPPSEDIPF